MRDAVGDGGHASPRCGARAGSVSLSCSIALAASTAEAGGATSIGAGLSGPSEDMPASAPASAVETARAMSSLTPHEHLSEGRRQRLCVSLSCSIALAASTAEPGGATSIGARPSGPGEDIPASAPASRVDAPYEMRSATAAMPLRAAAREANQGRDVKSVRPRRTPLARGSGVWRFTAHASGIKRALLRIGRTDSRTEPASQGCQHVCRGTSDGARSDGFGHMAVIWRRI